MTLTIITAEECIDTLLSYSQKEVRSWNPFKFFRKRKLKNNSLARELAAILGKPLISDNDLLKIGKAIDGFEDYHLQHQLLRFLYTNIADNQHSFLGKRENAEQISILLENLIDKQHRPWWTLFLFDVPYFPDNFRYHIRWLINMVSDLFGIRRIETKQHLIHVYSNDEIANSIITEYYAANKPNSAPQDELSTILDETLKQTVDHTKSELLKEIKDALITNVPFGRILISVGGLTSIINSYLSKKENQNKSVKEQAQDIMYIIGKVVLKINASQFAKAVGSEQLSDVAKAVVSVVTSQSDPNPLKKDRKIGTAFASVIGGAVGGTIGSVIPVFGTSIGAYAGIVASRTAAKLFYESLEAWQKAPKEAGSIIPGYHTSSFAFVDNDAENILEPIRLRYLNTEKELRILGDEIAKWLSIYTNLLQNSGGSVSEEYLEILGIEMQRLQSQFNKVQHNHSINVLNLYKLKPDNKERVKDYIAAVKECLNPLQKPLLGMLKKFFSTNIPASSAANTDSYTEIFRTIPAGTAPTVANNQTRTTTVLEEYLPDGSEEEEDEEEEEFNFFSGFSSQF